jgi:hypothetical protein
MLKKVLIVGISLFALMPFEPNARGMSKGVGEEGIRVGTPDDSPPASISKDKSCKARCEHNRATCRRKQRDCLAERQRCTAAC